METMKIYLLLVLLSLARAQYIYEGGETSSSCGENAEPKKDDQYACQCKRGYSGDPQTNCSIKHDETSPCDPNPCGLNSECITSDNELGPYCKCKSKSFGFAPNCEPGCENDDDCTDNEFCEEISHKCIKLCEDSTCGENSRCRADKNKKKAFCSCLDGFIIEKGVGCRLKTSEDKDFDIDGIKKIITDPCNEKCGENAYCDKAKCVCVQGYEGDPEKGCEFIEEPAVEDPCNPNECGEYSICKIVNGKAKCKCLEGFSGDPPYCSKCSLDYCDFCVGGRCVNDICSTYCEEGCNILNATMECFCKNYQTEVIKPFSFCGTALEYKKKNNEKLECSDFYPNKDPCGENAHCTIVDNKAYCQCDRGYSGDASKNCSIKHDEKSPCEPNPCGPNSECVPSHEEIGPHCKCKPKFFDNPPDCRPGCHDNDDCGENEFCDWQFNRCEKICFDTTCGENSHCRADKTTSRAYCSCLDGFVSEKYEGCRPKTSEDSTDYFKVVEDLFSSSCHEKCGDNAFCDKGKCVCVQGYAGDPEKECTLITSPVTLDACSPNQCGPYSTCKVFDDESECNCLEGFGNPPYCSHCKRNSCVMCIDGRCLDNENPCDSYCGYNAACHIFNNTFECFCNYEPKDIDKPFESCQVPPVGIPPNAILTLLG